MPGMQVRGQVRFRVSQSALINDRPSLPAWVPARTMFSTTLALIVSGGGVSGRVQGNDGINVGGLFKAAFVLVVGVGADDVLHM